VRSFRYFAETKSRTARAIPWLATLAAYELGPAAGIAMGAVASCGLWALIVWVVSLVV